jgi:hypothetical protein
MTIVILIRGPLEAFVVFLLARSWMRNYNDLPVLIYALCISILVAFFFGMSNYTGVLAQAQKENLFDLRFNLSALGGANYLGFFFVIIFPFIFVMQRKFGGGLALLMVVTILGMALASFSRSTPVVLGLQIFLLLCYKNTRKLAVVTLFVGMLMVSLVLCFAPSQMVSSWVERWYSSDAIGLVLGDAKRLDRGDSVRLEMKQNYWYQMPQYPMGGYGNPNEDPENMYLDLGLQLGWGPGVALILLQVFLFFVAVRRGLAAFRGKDDIGGGVFIAVIGEILYCYVTGVNFVKYFPSKDASSVTTNSVPAIYFALLMVLCLMPYKKAYKRFRRMLAQRRESRNVRSVRYGHIKKNVPEGSASE